MPTVHVDVLKIFPGGCGFVYRLHPPVEGEKPMKLPLTPFMPLMYWIDCTLDVLKE